MDCCLCEKEIIPTNSGWKLGNNAQPIMEGQCCDSCNTNIVVPRRINDMIERDIERTRLGRMGDVNDL